jgi:SPW repeat
MWARTVEFMLGCWIIISPFVFRHPADQSSLWVTDVSCGFAVVVISLLSYAPRLRYLHPGTAGVSLWLVLFGYFYQTHPTPAPLQNDILVGLLLMMFAIVPNESTLPPPSWRHAPSDTVLLYPEPPALSERLAVEEQKVRRRS